MSLLIGDASVNDVSLGSMKNRGGRWFAYQNNDLCHSEVGSLQFLKCGEGCTYQKPPSRLPDTEQEINWRYILVGEVDVDSGKII